MVKFLLFVYQEYDAGGGMNDLKGEYSSLAEAKGEFVPTMFEYAGKPYSNQFAEVWQIENSEITPVEIWGGYPDNATNRLFEWIQLTP